MWEVRGEGGGEGLGGGGGKRTPLLGVPIEVVFHYSCLRNLSFNDDVLTRFFFFSFSFEGKVSMDIPVFFLFNAFYFYSRHFYALIDYSQQRCHNLHFLRNAIQAMDITHP